MTHPSKSDLQATRRAIRQRWPLERETWEKALVDAVAVILDPATTNRLKLGAFLLVVDATSFGPFPPEAIESILKRTLGGREGCQSESCQIDTTESDPRHDARS
jgi:hypothetical protein